MKCEEYEKFSVLCQTCDINTKESISCGRKFESTIFNDKDSDDLQSGALIVDERDGE